MNARTHQRRLVFLNLKAALGSITPAEQSELQHLSLFRITETTSGTVLIEPHPIRHEDWDELTKYPSDKLRKITVIHKNT